MRWPSRATVGAYVIEDAAQALGARHRGVSVGLAGDVGFFSLAAGKGLSIYEGGLLLARDAQLRERLAHTAERSVPRSLRWEWKRSIELLGYAALYRPRGLRLAYGDPLRRALRRGDPVAAVGDDFPLTIPLHRVGRWRQAVGAHAAARLPAFLDAAGGAGAAAASASAPDRRHRRVRRPAGRAWHAGRSSCCCCPTGAAAMRRWRSCGRPASASAACSSMPCPTIAYLAGVVPAQDVPQARELAARSLSIGNSPWLDDEDFEAICAVLEESLR